MPLLSTRGAASAQGFGEFAQSAPANYIEDVFSTYLYTGNGSTQTITNGIDLSTYGGMVWQKARSAVTSNVIYDTSRGAGYSLSPQSTVAQGYQSDTLTSFSATGFVDGPDVANGAINQNGTTYASWTFRKQPKFFDIVTYTGDGTLNRAIAHNLGSAPGCVIVKRTNSAGDWKVWHRSLTESGLLQSTAAFGTSTSSGGARFQGYVSAADSTTFTVSPGASSNVTQVNATGDTYIAYLFAHNAGGFGLTGTDNVISCGSFTTDASGFFNLNLGYEPQWMLFKRTNGAQAWVTVDTMRSFSLTNSLVLQPNASNAEANSAPGYPTATGVGGDNASQFFPSSTYIYIAIRRGPMKTPTSGTSVFAPIATSGTYSSPVTLSTGFPVDSIFSKSRGLLAGYGYLPVDRLRGSSASTTPYLNTPTTNAEVNNAVGFNIANNTGATDEGFWTGAPSGGISYLMFRRAPGFFDVVCYTGTGSARTVTHNLGVAPELMIVKNRSSSDNWKVYNSISGPTKAMNLNTTDFSDNTTVWASTSPTSSVFTVSSAGSVNEAGSGLVAYLFASCPGVSKVGSYTGTGATLTISCGFAARFVLIKRTDSTGDWFVWDTARGMVAGTDPRLALNSTAAETNANWVYTDASGFQIVTTDATVNASGGSYIYLAIA